MKRRGIFLILAVVLVLSLIGTGWLFRQELLIRFAPRLVLSGAIQEAADDLEDRFSQGPGAVLGKALSPEGKQQAKLSLETTEPLLGVVRYDMDLYIQASPARILAEGNVFSGGKLLDLSVYLDGDFAALSSRELVRGQYYGITYDQFAQDLQSNDMLRYLLGEDKMQELQSEISALQTLLNRNYLLPKLQLRDVPEILLGVLALEPNVSAENLALSGSMEKCYAVHFAATGEEIAEAAQNYLAQLPEEMAQLIQSLTSGDSGVDITFYLQEQKLVKLSGKLYRAEASLEFDALLGSEPEENPVSLEISTLSDGFTNRLSMKADTLQEEERYQEVLEIGYLLNGQRTDWILDYSWNRTSGDLRMKAEKNGTTTDLRMNLLPSDGGFTLKTDDFEALKGLLTGKKKDRVTICSMAVTQGREVAVPDYKPFHQWSMEDLLILLRGFGCLLGLKLPG